MDSTPVAIAGCVSLVVLYTVWRVGALMDVRRRAAAAPPAHGANGHSWRPSFHDAMTADLISHADQVDVVIATATYVELHAVLCALSPLEGARLILKGRHEQETYYVGRFGCCTAAVTKHRMGATGSGAATLAAEHAIQLWRPRAVVMVGIAFGAGPDRQRIADVLVASQVISYEPQRVGAKQVVQRGPIAPSDTTLLNRFEDPTGWEFFRPDGSRCERLVGPVLSGEKLVDDPKFKEALFRTHPQAIGGEMEGAGLAAAAAAVSLVHHVLSQPDALHGLRKLPRTIVEAV